MPALTRLNARRYGAPMLLVALLSLTSPDALAVAPPPGCSEVTRSSAILSAVSQAEAAYETLDQDAFVAASLAASSSLPCLGEVLSVGTASAYARVQGLGAQLAGDKATRQIWFQAALALDPESELGQRIAPPGHPLRVAWDDARSAPRGERVELSLPPTASALVDGKVSGTSPSDRPALIQILGPDNRVLWTAFTWPMPTMPTARMLGLAELSVVASSAAAEAPGSLGIRKGLWLGAGASALAAGGLYAFAAAQHAAWDDDTNPALDDEAAIIEARGRINRMVLGSAGLGVVGVGLGATALFVREF